MHTAWSKQAVSAGESFSPSQRERLPGLDLNLRTAPKAESEMSEVHDHAITERIADFVHGLQASQLPAPVQHECTRSLVDSIGCIVAGGQHPVVSRARATLSQ